MARIQFRVVQVIFGAGHAIVVGRCCEAAFGVGAVFSSLVGGRFGRYDDKTGVAPQIGESSLVGVNLRVEELSFYGRFVERLCRGSAAGLRLSGDGLEALRRVQGSPHLVWALWGETGGTS
jgi:hypothetical protein